MRSGVFSFCKAIDTFCPLGPVDRDPRRDPGPARPGDDAARERRGPPESRTRAACRVTIPEILSHYSALGYSAGDVLSTGTVSGVAGFSPDAALAVPQAGRRDGGRDRADRRAAQPGRLVAGGARRAGAAARPLVRPGELAARRREARPRARADGRAGARRARRPRARQRPLPDELLGHEGLRRLRLPARGRAGADLPRGLGRGRRAHGLDGRRPLRPRLRPRRPAPAARSHARLARRGVARVRPRRARALARHAGVRPHGRRADDVHEGWFDAWPDARRRDAAARRGARDQDRPGDRADPARERDLAPRRWSTSATSSGPG